MSILKTGACFTAELELNCPTIVGCVTALPLGQAAVAGTTQVLGKDGAYHTLPAAPVVGSAQTGLSNDVSAIPAPTASQSPWGQNLLGETLHYAPGLGWQIVDKKYGYSEQGPIADTSLLAIPLTMPRAGFITASAYAGSWGNAAGYQADLYVYINAGASVSTIVAMDRTVYQAPGDTLGANAHSSCAASRVPVAAGQVVTFNIRNTTPGSNSEIYRISYTYE